MIFIKSICECKKDIKTFTDNIHSFLSVAAAVPLHSLSVVLV